MKRFSDKLDPYSRNYPLAVLGGLCLIAVASAEIELSLQEGMKVRVTASGEQNFSGTKSLVIKELA